MNLSGCNCLTYPNLNFLISPENRILVINDPFRYDVGHRPLEIVCYTAARQMEIYEVKFIVIRSIGLRKLTNIVTQDFCYFFGRHMFFLKY